MRIAIVVACVATLLVIGSRTSALAAPCAVEPRSVVRSASPNAYFVDLRSFSSMHARLRLTLFAGDDSYAVDVADASLTKKGTGLTPVDPTWTTTVPVALPDGIAEAKGLQVRTLGSNGEAVECTGGSSGIPVPGDTTKRSARKLAADASPPVVATFVRHEVPAECERPYVAARLLKPARPEYPEAARSAYASGTVLVSLDLNEDGKAISSPVVGSSGFALLDRSATEAALGSQYAPQIFRCTPVAGSYLFEAQFKYR